MPFLKAIAQRKLCSMQVDFGTWGTSGLSKNVFTAEQGVSYYVVLEAEEPFPDCDGASVEVVSTSTGILFCFASYKE